jgi:predicted ATP-grasp superfamily ATP-dependent carboligase
VAGGLADRAAELARRAARALPKTTGYIGIDLVLGNDPRASGDVVIEVNPRLTTSYVGLRAAALGNIADWMIRTASGEAPQVQFSPRPLEFDVEGNVSFLP